MAAVTNYHRLGGLDKQKCVLCFPEARRVKSVPLGWSQGVGRAALPPKTLGENVLASSCFWHSLALSHIIPISACLHFALSNLPLPLSLIRKLMMAFRLSRIIYLKALITCATSSPWKVNFHRYQGVGPTCLEVATWSIATYYCRICQMIFLFPSLLCLPYLTVYL